MGTHRPMNIILKDLAKRRWLVASGWRLRLLSAAGLQQIIFLGPRSRSKSRSGGRTRSGGCKSPVGPLTLCERPRRARSGSGWRH